MKIVVGGGSGFVGKALGRVFSDAEVVILSRSGKGGAKWDASTVGPWAEALEGADAVINLAGEPVAQPWTPAVRKAILDSRVESTRAIGQAIRACQTPPKIWINASAVGFYGSRGDEVLTEASSPGPETDFLVETCLAWEREVFEAPVSIPRAAIRIGFVLGNDGGALPLLAKLTRGFLGGAVGDGRQYMPWIHVDDLARMFRWVLEGGREGVYNGTAPDPATNADFMTALRKQIGRPWSPPAPKFGLQLFRAVGGPEPQVALMSTRAKPARALSEGFAFGYPDLPAALKNLLA